MKKSYKYFITCIIVLIVITTIPLAKIIIDGYSRYREVTNDTDIEEKIEMIKDDKDYTELDCIDKDFLNAIISIEDHRFFKHNGLDYIGIARATINNIKAGRIVQGGSTITQQLAKNLYLDTDKNFSRKVAEVFLVKDIEKYYSKEEILEVYVNIINYGNGYIGIKEASEGYFNEEADDLNFEEASMLAGLPQCPEGYNLKKHYDKALSRKEQVLAAINRYGYIDYSNEYYLLSR